MACDICWALPQPPKKRSFLIQLIDEETGKWGRCVVQSECQHGMQEWMEYLAENGQLTVHDQNDEAFVMLHPVVVDINDKAAAHIPLVDPVN